MSHCSDLQAQPTKPAVVSQPRLALGLVFRCPPLGQCLSLYHPRFVCRTTLCYFCLDLLLSEAFSSSGFHVTHRQSAQNGRGSVPSLRYP